MHEIPPDVLLSVNEPWFRPSVLEAGAGVASTGLPGLGTAVREVLSQARLRFLTVGEYFIFQYSIYYCFLLRLF